MRWRGRKFALLVVLSAALLSDPMLGVGQANTEAVQSYGRLGHGLLMDMKWEVWGELKTAKGSESGAEEACISVVTLEPTEGNESKNCGPPMVASLEEIVRSQYGVVAAGLYASNAKRVVICIKGGRELKLRLKRLRVSVGAARPTYRYSYFARGFDAETRIKWMTALDGTGNVIAAGPGRRQCL